MTAVRAFGTPLQDVDRLIDALPLGRMQWTVFALCALVVFLEGYDLQALALAVPFVAKEWGIAPPSFSLALSASLIGQGIGGALLAPLGDRFGRKPLLVSALLAMGLGTLATLLVPSPAWIAGWRFVTGLGFGIAGVNSTALTAEYAPARRRFLIMTLMNCNVPGGAFVAAFTAPALILDHGWRAVFVIGGVAPLAFAIAFALYSPESLKWLLARPTDARRVGRLARRLLPGIDPADLISTARPTPRRRSILALLVPEYRIRTLVIWLAAASGAFVLYGLSSWLPTLLRLRGWDVGAALRGAAAIQLGGLAGSLLMAWAVDRGRLAPALLTGYAVSTVGLLSVALAPGSVATGTLLFVLIGSGVAGMQAVWMAIAVALFPIDLRATSAGWLSLMSRTGAIAAPFAGGAALAADLGMGSMMLALLAPIALSGTALALSRRHFVAGAAAVRAAARHGNPLPIEG